MPDRGVADGSNAARRMKLWCATALSSPRSSDPAGLVAPQVEDVLANWRRTPCTSDGYRAALGLGVKASRRAGVSSRAAVAPPLRSAAAWRCCAPLGMQPFPPSSAQKSCRLLLRRMA